MRLSQQVPQNLISLDILRFVAWALRVEDLFAFVDSFEDRLKVIMFGP